MANTLAYYNAAIVTVVKGFAVQAHKLKSFIVQTGEEQNIFEKKNTERDVFKFYRDPYQGSLTEGESSVRLTSFY